LRLLDLAAVTVPKRNPPPLVIDSARVVSYAFVDDIPYCKWGALYSGEQLIEHVPCLAICLNLGKDIGPLLFHCDHDPGVSARWVDLNTSAEDALRYYDEQIEGLKCSFCGKRPFEIEGGWVEGTKAAICRECVEKYYQVFQERE
jgi:ClpX C4-type zinc finger